MANPLKGEVPITIGGTSYVLKLSYNALCDVEQSMGQKAPEIIREVGTGSWTAARALFCAALRHSKPDLTLEQAGELIQSMGMKASTEALTNAFTAAFGEKEEGPENPP